MLKQIEVKQWLNKRISKPYTLEYWYMGDLQPGLGAWSVSTQEKDFSMTDWEPVRLAWDKEFKPEVTGNHLWHGVKCFK